MRLLWLLFALCPLLAQTPNPVQWTVTATAAKAEPGAAIRMKLAATIEPGWHLYSVTSPVTATATKITAPFAVTATWQQKVEAKFDAVAAATTESYEGSAVFYVDGTLQETVKDLEVTIRSSACNDKVCLPPKRRTFPIVLTIGAPEAGAPEGFVAAKTVAAAPAVAVPVAPAKPAAQDLSSFLLVAFGLGLAAVFTPCVFPMIPFTLSYFIGQGDQKGSLGQAIVFCLGIVVLFTGMGFILSAALGPFAVVQLSANPWVNLTIAAVFFAFALSMLGAFEIMLPSSLLTKLNQASEGGGYVGALLMGLTFSLTSFACVGPFVGTLLAASVQGDKLQPILGMAAFSSGLATPFFLLSLFPAYLKKLPRSGVWMMRVKVVMAFLILAAMLKYLAKVDSVLQLELLTRERFLAGWMILFSAAGAYLLGWLRLEGIKPEQDVTIPRLLLGVLLLAFSLSLFPGMMGSSLGDLDAYVPLASKASGGGGGGGGYAAMPWKKNDLAGALAQAKAEGKQVFVNFTGYACTNCHWMKANMFPRPEIAAALGKYVLVELYTDGTDAASEANQKIQEAKFATAAIPYYVILDAEEKTVRSFPGLTKDPQEFLKFLAP
jgi:thiol:disulfide interchange protein